MAELELVFKVFTKSDNATVGWRDNNTWTWSSVPLIAIEMHFLFKHVATMYLCISFRWLGVRHALRPLVAKMIWFKEELYELICVFFDPQIFRCPLQLNRHIIYDVMPFNPIRGWKSRAGRYHGINPVSKSFELLRSYFRRHVAKSAFCKYGLPDNCAAVQMT